MTSRRARTSARWLGDILMTLGVVVLLLLVYQLWWTNVTAARAAEAGRAQLVAAWQAAPASTNASPAAIAEPAIGQPFALMYIPRLRSSVWGTPVVQGVGLDELAQGIGHYPGSAMPGQVGNFATAGHRATHGEPFKDIDQVKQDDHVIIETANSWYVYALDDDVIVQPSDTWVIDPVPGRPKAQPTEALITLTTCNPRWASTQRWIWWGHLIQTRSHAQGPPADLRVKD